MNTADQPRRREASDTEIVLLLLRGLAARGDLDVGDGGRVDVVDELDAGSSVWRVRRGGRAA